MNDQIVTICTASYGELLQPWLAAVRKLTQLSVAVLCLNGYRPKVELPCELVQVKSVGNPFPENLPDHACAEKLRLFEHLPRVDRILFLDIDVFVMHPFWENSPYFEISSKQLVMCPDLFVGYKEKMEDEFQPYDRSFRMRHTSDGEFFYFNTGVFFASREAHAKWFCNFLRTWKDYVATTGKLPSIFDQNVFNYCLIHNDLQVQPMPVINNCLRQYEEQVVVNGQLQLNGERVNACHFNGGDGPKKMERWHALQQKLEVSHDAP